MAKPVKKIREGDWIMTEQGVPGVVCDVDTEHGHLESLHCFIPSQSRLLTPAEIVIIKVGGTLGPIRPNKP